MLHRVHSSYPVLILQVEQWKDKKYRIRYFSTWSEWLDRQEDSRVVSWFLQTKFSHQPWWFLSHLACSNKQRDNVKNTINNGGMIDSRVTDIGDNWQWVNKIVWWFTVGSWHEVSDGKIIEYTWLLKTTFGNLQIEIKKGQWQTQYLSLYWWHYPKILVKCT